MCVGERHGQSDQYTTHATTQVTRRVYIVVRGWSIHEQKPESSFRQSRQRKLLKYERYLSSFVLPPRQGSSHTELITLETTAFDGERTIADNNCRRTASGLSLMGPRWIPPPLQSYKTSPKRAIQQYSHRLVTELVLGQGAGTGAYMGACVPREDL